MSTQQQARLLRRFRWLHRKVAIILFVFFLIISVTGILLGIKKNTGLLAPTQKGSSSQLADWLPIDSLQQNAVHYLAEISPDLSPAVDRIDIRPEKGVAKFTFKDHYHGLQLDGATGKLLLHEIRRSDWIEDLHDGSLVDSLIGTRGEPFKTGYTIIMGFSLFLLVITGVWLWWGPKRLRKSRGNR
ncbi:MAG: PepSY-associated TM helix domain-containing protein [Chitinophagaceae bacterium]|nr:PepSY-associated TM helix domain-containing protein [Chitinophagaceae bacterium]